MAKLSRNVLVAAIMACGLVSPAVAQSGAGGAFTIVNTTEGNVVTGFYTSEDGENFSANWLSADMQPGDEAEAVFAAQSGNCIQYFVVGWAGENGVEVEDDVTEIDICNASIVYLGDNEISFE